MKAPPLVAGVLLGLYAVGGSTALVQEQDVADLAQGIRQAQDGDFEAALLTLDRAARTLAPLARPAELARAYVYLGVAYLGLGQETLAALKFRQAIRQSPETRLRQDEFSARVLRAFEAARLAEGRAVTMEKEVKKSKGKGGLLLLGAGAAAAAGLGVALVRERKNSAPTVSLNVSPEGTALVYATRVTFTATATDVENDPLSYTWDLGDGTTGSGHVVSHTYTRTGAMQVRVTVSDGLASTQATTSLTVGTIQGTWLPTGAALMGVTAFPIGPIIDSSFTFRPVFPGGVPSGLGGGLVTHPRTLIASFRDPFGPLASGGGPCILRFDATADSALQRISGTLACESTGPPCACAGQQQPLTLVR